MEYCMEQANRVGRDEQIGTLSGSSGGNSNANILAHFPDPNLKNRFMLICTTEPLIQLLS